MHLTLRACAAEQNEKLDTVLRQNAAILERQSRCLFELLLLLMPAASTQSVTTSLSLECCQDADSTLHCGPVVTCLFLCIDSAS